MIDVYFLLLIPNENLIIIIAFKGAIRDFWQYPHSTVNCLQHVRSSGPAQSCANHVQHIEPLSRASVMLRATWFEGTAQLLSLTELKSHLFELYFIDWTIKPMKERRKPEYPEKTPGNELQKKLWVVTMLVQFVCM